MIKKIERSAVAFALALSSIGLAIVSTQAHAAGLPTIRVTSPTFNSANDTFASDNLGQYYAAGGRSFYMYVGAGSTINITYAVTKDGTTPYANQEVDLFVDSAYSGSKAHWTANGAAINPPASADATFGKMISGTTDASGNVTFTLVNTDTANLEPVPSSATAPRATAGRLYGTMKVVLPGIADMAEVTDIVTFDITSDAATTLGGSTPAPAPSPTATPTATPTPTPTPTPVVAANPSIRLVNPALTSVNSVDSTADIAQYYSAKTKAFYTYLAAGSTVTLTYQVTTDGTTPAVNKEVNLYVDSAYSGSKAHWKVGATSINPPATADATFGKMLTGTTDSSGLVKFTITNADTSGLELAPSAPNQDRSNIKPARLFGTIKPVLAGVTDDKAEDTDLVTFDIYAGAKPVAKSVTITCVKGKTTRKVSGLKPACPTGFKKK